MLIVESKSLTTYVALLKCDDIHQAEIAQTHIRNLGYSNINIVSGGDYSNLNVPHFNEYVWND